METGITWYILVLDSAQVIFEQFLTLPDNNDWGKMGQQADHSWDEGQYVMIYPGEGNGGLWIGMKAKEANNNPDGAGVQDGLKSFGNKNQVIAQTKVEQAGNLTSLQGSKVLTDHGVVMDVSGPEWQAATDVDFTSKASYTQEGKTGTLTKTAGWAVDPVNKVYDAHYLIGNYYQWLAATAQTREEGAAVTTEGQNVEGSICAKNWQLPYSGESWNNASGSFFNLIKSYAGDALKVGGAAGSNADKHNGYSSLSNVISGSTTVESVLTGMPMQFPRAGNVTPWSSNQQVRNVGAGGRFWSSVASGASNARGLGVDPANVYPSRGYYRAYGFSVRCLVLGQ